MEVMQGRAHYDYLDIAKGIGIILVVAGHALSASDILRYDSVELLRTLIYLVHMPLFFVISGVLFELNRDKYAKCNWHIFIKNKARVFLLPYVTFSVLLFLIVSIGIKISALQGLIERLGTYNSDIFAFIKSIILYYHPIDEHLWFSYVMFLVLTIAFCLIKIPDRYLLPAFYLLYVLTWFVSLPEIIWKVMRYLFLFYSGKYLVRRNKLLNAASMICVFVVSFALYYYFRQADMVCAAFIKPAAELSGVWLVLHIARKIQDGSVKKLFARLGRQSYEIYLMHQPYIVPVVVAVAGKTLIGNCAGIVLAVILGCVIPIIVKRLIIDRSKTLRLLLLGGH